MDDQVTLLGRLLAGLPMGVMLLSRNGDLRGHNDRVLELLGVSVEDLLLATPSQAVGDERLSLALAEVGETGGRMQFMLEREGRSLSCLVSTVEMDQDDDLAILVLTDATPFRQMEEIKREFVETILHRLRSPLATLKTSLSLLCAGRMAEDPGRTAEVAAMSYHEVNRLNALVGDLRTLFVIETGLAAKELEPEVFAVEKAVHAAVTALDRIGGATEGATGRCVVSGETGALIKADFAKTKQIFMSIVANALIFSPSGPPVQIRVENEAGTTVVTVTDRGIGIPAQVLPLVFTKFFRGDNHVTRSVDGNGLGMFLARALTELMGGSIWCDSKADEGTTVQIHLPSRSREQT